MSKFESSMVNYLSKNGLDLNNSQHEIKAAKYALKLYNKINGTNFKSKAPKIIIMKIDINKKSNRVSA